MSNDLPYLHGDAHRPGGSDPAATGPWHYIASSTSGTAWSSATAYSAGDTADHDVYRYLCLVANTNVEPNVDAHWANYWIIDVPIFQNGWKNMSATGDIPDPVPMGYRIAVGKLNRLDRDTGALVQHLDHQLELAGDITGGAQGTVVFYLPPAYRLSYDKPVPGHDDLGGYMPSRLYTSDGSFVRGTS